MPEYPGRVPRFRIVIVDEEEVSRRRLRRLISLHPDCEVTAEFISDAEVVTALCPLRADIVFLDAQMATPDALNTRALVILMSAHDERAFEAEVFDYLLKPFGRQRFEESLRRAKSRLVSDHAVVQETHQERQPLPVRIAVRNKGSIVFVKVDDIDWIEAADNYVILHRGKESHVVRVTMNELQARLDAGRFVRIHRSRIVNLERIRELRPWFRGDYVVILRDGTELTMAKSHRAGLASRLLLGAA